ncbi:hypothetical protein J6S88_03910 [bacterium]|nr:hypothetical protein [bacterium]
MRFGKKDDKKKKEEATAIPVSKDAYANSITMAESMGMNLKKAFVFPDGAKLSFMNINEKNVKTILAKYENYLRPDYDIIEEDITYNKDRMSILYQDEEAILAIGRVDNPGNECAYKIYKKGSNKVFATFFFECQEEVIVFRLRKIVKYYDNYHRLIKIVEKTDDETKTFKISPETHGIAFETSKATKEKDKKSEESN